MRFIDPNKKLLKSSKEIKLCRLVSPCRLIIFKNSGVLKEKRCCPQLSSSMAKMKKSRERILFLVCINIKEIVKRIMACPNSKNPNSPKKIRFTISKLNIASNRVKTGRNRTIMVSLTCLW